MLQSISQLADLTGLDRQTITRRLKAVSLAWTEQSSAKMYESRDALPVLYRHESAVAQDEKETLTAARTNESNAKARKTWIEVESLEKGRIPLEVFHPVLEQCFGGISTIIKRAPLAESAREEILAQLRDVPAQLKW